MIDFDGAPDGDDDDLALLLASELDKAEGVKPAAEPDAEIEPTAEEIQAVSDAEQRARDEKGRFSKKAEEEAAKPETEQAAAPVQAAATEAPKPPPGWSPAAKVAFDALPAEVKESVAKREVEINAGFAKLSEYKGLEPLAELAKQNGTNLVQAVNEYRDFEVKLQNDFIGGIGFVCQRFGVNPLSLAQAILSRSGGAAQAQPGYQQPPQQPDISPVLQRLQRLEGEIQQRQQIEAQRQQTEAQSEIQKFSSANRFFENVRPAVANLIRSGQATTLQDAYDQACWMNPEVRAVLIKEQSAGTNGQASAAQRAAVAAQARSASKSIKGAPTPGAASQRVQSSIEDEVRNAWDASTGSV